MENGHKKEKDENRSCGSRPGSFPAVKTCEKCWRLPTLRIGFGEKHRQILLGDFRKGLDITLGLKQKGKHRHLLHMHKCQGDGKYSSCISWLRWAEANKQQIIPDVTFQWSVCKEIQKYSWFKGQTGERRRLVACWGVRHLTQESLQSTRNAKSIRCGSTLLLCQGGRGCCGFSTAVETTPLPSQRGSQVNLSPPHLRQRDLKPQWTFLPLCPPASPWSLLLDALLLSGSESVDLGLSGRVKDHPFRSEPWAPPPAQPAGWVQESLRSRASYK